MPTPLRLRPRVAASNIMIYDIPMNVKAPAGFEPKGPYSIFEACFLVIYCGKMFAEITLVTHINKNMCRVPCKQLDPANIIRDMGKHQEQDKKRLA